ncbi:hypothetical protein AAEO56_11045 [Flavobacterium sp. DGU11]|uniref:Uncharacterized protein n=1 Tax=Flavobacterium arundinis TaxID=3139143 RepID=A0ABU9HXE4_9FLAO
MDLKELHDKLVAEGCNRFCIEGIGQQSDDDVEQLGLNDGKWEVRYFERGRAEKTLFSTADKDEAIRYYYNYIMKIEHWHIIAFTRSFDIFNAHKEKLEAAGIKTIQNDIPYYAGPEDRVYRLFVTNKDIFKAREIFDVVPYYDENLKR